MNLKLKNIIFLLLLTIVTAVHAQNVSNSKGKQGPWVVYHSDGKSVKYKGQFLNDKPTGKFVYYYITGDPSMVVDHKSDGVSECKMYHVNGSLMAAGNYVNQLKEGDWWYFNNEKKTIAKEVYANGMKNGVCYEYFPTASDEKLKILRETVYINDLAQGVWKQFYKDGKLQTKGNYLNGLYSGECIWYNAQEKAEMYGYFKEGKKHGKWRNIDDNGDIKYIVYKDDIELSGRTAEVFLKSLSK